MPWRTARSMFSLMSSVSPPSIGFSTPSMDLTMRGMISRPVASRAVITASCSGVVSTNPWPIEALRLSPITQSAPRFDSFHCLSGISPPFIPGRGRSYRAPSPSLRPMAAIRSIPARWAIS